MSRLLPYLTQDADLSFLGLSPYSEEERLAAVPRLLNQMSNYRRSLQVYLDSCVHCGACIRQCHSYLGTEDIHNTPVGRADLVRRVFKRSGLKGRRAQVEHQDIADWYTYFYQCNECRRCAEVCPLGIDTAEVTIAMREILAYTGMVPRFLSGVARNLYQTGNNMGINPLALKDMAEFLEDELAEETGKRIPVPVNDTGAEVLYNPSSSDLFTNTDNLMGVAKVFYAAGISWTLSEQITETANFGLFFHEPTLRHHHQNLVDSARELRVQRVVAGECGHGWRTWRMFKADLEGQSRRPVTHICEEAWHLIRSGAVRVDQEANPLPVTYHDPCNLGRGGGLYEEPRQVLQAVAGDYREMTPNREMGFCCGGGSGLLMEEMNAIRIHLGAQKAKAIEATGARIVCAPCAICKAQLPMVMKAHGIEAEVKGLMDLVGYALVL